jgi:hypothetical protein
MPHETVGTNVMAAVVRVEEYGIYFKDRERNILVLIPESSALPVRDLKAHFTPGAVLKVRIVRHVPETGEYIGSLIDVDED